MADERCIIKPERDCISKAAEIRLELRIEQLEKWQESSREFHESFYDWQRSQIARDAKLDEQLKAMNAYLEKVVEYQEGQKSKPGKRWDAIVDKAIWAVLAAIIAFVLAKFGL